MVLVVLQELRSGWIMEQFSLLLGLVNILCYKIIYIVCNYLIMNVLLPTFTSTCSESSSVAESTSFHKERNSNLELHRNFFQKYL